MTYSYVPTPNYTCPGSQSQWATIPATNGTIVSVGVQNGGYKKDLYITQVFAYQPDRAFVQVTNTSTEPREWRAWTVLASSSDEEAPELGEIQLGTSEPESANG